MNRFAKIRLLKSGGRIMKKLLTAYYKVLPKGALKTYNNWHIVHPFTFVGNFQGDFKAS